MEKKYNCDNCGKKDCEQCVKEGGKTFCCEHCCDDFKAKKDQSKKEPANVCVYC